MLRKYLLLFLLITVSVSLKAEKLYWVGGFGNFNDPSHWSLTSGGKGGAKAPTEADDVVFDLHSFKTPSNSIVTIQGPVKVHGFSVSEKMNQVTFEGSSTASLYVNGSLNLKGNIKWQYSGTIHFTSQHEETIDFGLVKPIGDIHFKGLGSWVLKSNLASEAGGSVYFESGYLTVNDLAIMTTNLMKIGTAPFYLALKNAILSADKIIKTDATLNITQTNSEIYFKQGKPGFDQFYAAGANGLRIIPHPNDVMVVTVSNITPETCNGDCDATALVTFSGAGTGPYTIQWINATSPNTFNAVAASPFLCTGLCPGNYTVRVVGTLITATANVIIPGPSPITTLVSSMSEPLCNGDCDGKIIYNIIGGNPNYTAVWNPGAISHNNLAQGIDDSITGICTGTYTITISDTKGCTGKDSFQLLEPTVIAANAGKQDQQCFGVCNSMTWVAPSGGTPFGVAQPSGTLYTVVWDASGALTNDTLYNLCPTTHNYVITDANGCTMPGSVTVNPVTQLTFTPSVPAPITCFDVCNGTANVSNISGGTGPGTYTYSWSGPSVPTVVNTANSSTASAMCPGVYICTITDANGCDTTKSFTITSPALLVGSISTKTDVTCFGGSNGTATGTQAGGTGPAFTYNWFSTTSPTGGPPFSNANPTVNGLIAGNYTLVVVDANGCNDTVTFAISQPLQLQVTLTPTNPTCFGFTNGQICVATSGGTGVATFTLSPVAGALVANCYTNLPAGPYTVNATDANACPASASTTLTSLPQILVNLTHTDPTCNLGCNGTATSAPTGGSGAGYTFVWSCNPATTASINGECAGVCNLIVTDGNACPQNASVTFVDPNPLTVSLTATTLNCAGASTAQITSTVNGGTPPYLYSWNTGPTTPGLANVGAGTYDLTVTDANGCSKLASVTIASPPPITITTTPTNPTCFGSCNGSITTVLGGGTPPYSQLWLPNNSASLNQANLCAGVYTINVKDAKKCPQTAIVTLTAPQQIVVTTDTTVTSCINVCDGTATANAVGGNAGGYTYLWSNAQATQTATGLCDGSYNVTVTDPLGCTGIGSATVTEPTSVTTAVISITPSCSNICNGTATINPGGGTPAYTHTLDAVAVGSTALSGLCVGPHTVVTTDNNGCTASTNFVVPVQVTLSVTASPGLLTCNGDCNGTATANVVGGTGALTFLWTSPPPTVAPTQSTQTAVNLCAGIHTITVTDNIGCTVSSSVTFTNPPVLTAPVTVTPVDCNGNCTGSATSTPAGGVAPYSISWSNGGVGNTISNLCVGSYDATVTDANGCSITQTGIVIQPSAFTITLTPTSPTTCGGTDGSIAAVVGGGTGAYNYLWNPSGQTTSLLSNVGAAVYSLTITDQNTGCDTTLTFGLSDPNAPGTTGDSTNVTCPGLANGTITVDVTSGTAPFVVTFPGGAPTGAPPLTANNLAAGTYAVQVTDATACVAFENVTITQPSNFIDNEVLTNVSCNGGNNGSIVLSPTGGTRPFTYVLDGLPEADSSMTGLIVGAHALVVTDANGCTYPFNYTLTEPTALTATESHTNVNCTTGFGTASVVAGGGAGGYTYLWTTVPPAVTTAVANLTQGSYTVTVTDINGCTAQDTLTIAQNPALVSGFLFTNNLCSGGCSGTASFNASGGSGVYTYAWSSSALVASSLNAICPGVYSATVSDNNGCSVVENFTIVAPTLLDVTSVATDPLCNGSCNGTITANPTGGTGAYGYVWSPNVNITQTSVNLCAGSYTVDVTDVNGCVAQDILVLTDPITLLANVTPTQPTCFGDCNGMLVSTPVGGTAPFTYAWGPAPVGVNDTLSGLCIGNYSVTVTDVNGCSDVGNIVLTQPLQVGLVASSSAATCGLVPCNGSIVINSIVGTTVNWLDPGIICTSCLAQNSLCAGIYSIEVSDAAGCKDTVPVVVSNSSGPLVDVDSTNVICTGNCDGTATVISVTGTGPFTYGWAAPIVDVDSIASNLCAGTYISQVTDGIGCITFTNITVNEPVLLDDNEVITDAACNGVNTGSIVLAPTGGTAPYNYLWSNNALLNSPNNTNLAPGNYTVDITDANLCTYSFAYTVNSNSQVLYNLAVANATCFAQCNGTATLSNISGGTAPYTFVWNDGQSGTIANGLCAGNYTVTITDNVGCFIAVDTTISEPVQLNVNPTVTNTACGVCAGSIALAPVGGTGAFTYLWSNGQSAATATNLCAGVYMVDVTDAAGCVNQQNIAVNNTSGPTVTTVVVDVTCAGSCNGSATATPVGGTLPYQYNWIAGGQTTAAVANLCAGTYFVQVKDGANCVINDTVVINETSVLAANLNLTPTTCGASVGQAIAAPSGGTAPYSFVWSTGSVNDTISGLAAGSYSLEITDATGCKDTVFATINSNNGPVVTVATDSTLCNASADGSATLTVVGGVAPYTIAWSTGLNANSQIHNSLSSGVYSVVVTDNGGCASVKNFTIEEPLQLALSLNNTQLPSCQVACNGALTAIPNGGSLAYSYAWSNGALTDTISNLCAGLYSVTVTDGNGCTATQITQLNNNATPFTVTDNNVNATCGLCDGTSSLTVNGGQVPYSYNWSNGSVISSAANLCAAIYSVDITDNLGCTQQHNVSINNINGPTVNVVSTNVTCAGQCTGTATATGSGGIAPYQYNWLVLGQTTSAVTNLCAGTYFVQVKDANNCVTNDTAIISEINVLAATPIVTNATCGVCDGAVTLNPTGGSGTYTFAWSNGLPATISQNNLCAQTYSVEITDVINGCKDTSFVTINSTNAPTVVINTDSTLCNGSADGQAVLAINGGSFPYGVVWSTGLNVNSPTHTSLSAGNYAVTVTDALGCVNAQVFTIDEPSQLALSLSNTQLPNCGAICNGGLTALPSGGILSYTYLWSPGGVTTDTLNHLCVGVYQLTVTDAKGCTAAQTTALNPNPTPFNISNVVTDPGCNLCDGVIDITMNSGIPPFTYVWSNGNTTQDIDTVCAGLYNVDITDSAGCTQTVSFPISNVAGIAGETITQTNESCAGSCDGTATVVPLGGTPGYTYQWLHNGATTNSQAGLCSSLSPYFLQISDTNNCIRTSQIDILSPNQMTASTSIVAPGCALSDGSITLNVSGGTAPYTYVWSGGVAGNTNTANGLAAGVYTIDVTDAAVTPCTQTFTVTLSNINGPLVNVLDTNVSCNGLCDGSIALNITSINPTTVLWNTGSGATSLNLLCPANYTAVITDNILGCSTAISAAIAEPDTIVYSISTSTDPLCFGTCTGSINSVPSGGVLPYTFTWSPVAGGTPALASLCANTYSVTVTDANGCNNMQTTILTEPPVITISGAVINTSCTSVAAGSIDITVGGGTPGYTYQWSGGSVATTQDISSLLFGQYTVTVTDTNLCTIIDSFSVAATDTVIANAGLDQVFCLNGNVTLDGSLSNVNNGTITYSWEQIPTSGVLGTLDTLVVPGVAGITSYQLVITNSLGCSDSDTVAITANPLPLANAGIDQQMFIGQTVTIGGNPTGPAGTTFSWLPTTDLSNNTAANPIASPTLAATYNYTVVVTDAATGCVSRDSMVLIVLPKIIIPNGISPNGDGKNDTWIIDAIYKFPNNQVEIYNRWGELLYAKTAYDNTWDGSYKGKPLPIGTYYYVVKLNDPDYPEPYTGPITIFK